MESKRGKSKPMKKLILLNSLFLMSIGHAQNIITPKGTGRIQCQTSIRGGSYSSGRCGPGEVIVSIQSTNPLMTRCGVVQVDCYGTTLQKETDNSDEKIDPSQKGE
jgi:hypothetical protein